MFHCGLTFLCFVSEHLILITYNSNCLFVRKRFCSVPHSTSQQSTSVLCWSWSLMEIILISLSDEQPFIFLFRKFYVDIRWHNDDHEILLQIWSRAPASPQGLRLRSRLAQAPAPRSDPGPPTLRHSSVVTRRTRPGLLYISEQLREYSFSFIIFYRNAPQLQLVFLCAVDSIQSGVDSRTPGRQAPAHSVLREPDEPHVPHGPLPNLLILHVAVRVTYAGGLQSVSLDSREVETRSEPRNINSPAVIKWLAEFVLSQDLEKIWEIIFHPTFSLKYGGGKRSNRGEQNFLLKQKYFYKNKNFFFWYANLVLTLTNLKHLNVVGANKNIISTIVWCFNIMRI